MDQELMKDEDRKKIEEIIGEMKCPKHFKWDLRFFARQKMLDQNRFSSAWKKIRVTVNSQFLL